MVDIFRNQVTLATGSVPENLRPNSCTGYAEAAVKLQRDWRVDAESLPFAKSIRGHALISLVQKGLRYHHLSLTIDEVRVSSHPMQESLLRANPIPEWPTFKATQSIHVLLRSGKRETASTTKRRYCISGTIARESWHYSSKTSTRQHYQWTARTCHTACSQAESKDSRGFRTKW